jgi:hypothetical protein
MGRKNAVAVARMSRTKMSFSQLVNIADLLFCSAVPFLQICRPGVKKRGMAPPRQTSRVSKYVEEA